MNWNIEFESDNPHRRHEAQAIRYIEQSRRSAISSGEYTRLRAKGLSVFDSKRFPLPAKVAEQRIPKWKSSSDWFKVQMGVLAMANDPLSYLQISVRINEALIARHNAKLASSDSFKGWIRNRLSRALRTRFGGQPAFYFVIEDRTKAGKQSTRAHIHGAIASTRIPLPDTRLGQPPAEFVKIARERNLAFAEARYGDRMIKEALKEASGNWYRRKPKGLIYARGDVWAHNPFGTTSYYPSYAFKNVGEGSKLLQNDRIARNQRFIRMGRSLWDQLSGR